MRTIRNCMFYCATVFFLMATSALAQDYTGWWWNPEAPGTGYSLEVQDAPDRDYDLGYLVWYAFDEDGESTWYSAILHVTGNTMGGALAEYDGWPWGSGEPTEVTAIPVGWVKLEFSDADTGILSLIIEGEQYQRHIHRWETEGQEDPRGLTGWWWDESKPGMGWFLQARNNRLFAGSYAYNSYTPWGEGGEKDTEPVWYIALNEEFSEMDTESSASQALYYGGQTLTGPYRVPFADQLSKPLIASLPLDSSLQSIELSMGSHSYSLTRFTIPDIFDGDIGCAPEILNMGPMGELYGGYNAIVSASLELGCDSGFDPDSVIFRFDGEVVEHYLGPSSTENRLDVRYDARELEIFVVHYVSVTASDTYGNTSTAQWSFYSQAEWYR